MVPVGLWACSLPMPQSWPGECGRQSRTRSCLCPWSRHPAPTPRPPMLPAPSQGQQRVAPASTSTAVPAAGFPARICPFLSGEAAPTLPWPSGAWLLRWCQQGTEQARGGGGLALRCSPPRSWGLVAAMAPEPAGGMALLCTNAQRIPHPSAPPALQENSQGMLWVLLPSRHTAKQHRRWTRCRGSPEGALWSEPFPPLLRKRLLAAASLCPRGLAGAAQRWGSAAPSCCC